MASPLALCCLLEMARTNPLSNFSTVPALGSLNDSMCFGGTPSQSDLSDSTRYNLPVSLMSLCHKERSRGTASFHHFQPDFGRITARVAGLFLVDGGGDNRLNKPTYHGRHTLHLCH